MWKSTIPIGCLTGAFNPETIDRFELATGGFGVKYGDRLSSPVVETAMAPARRLWPAPPLQRDRRERRRRRKLPGGLNGRLASGRRTHHDIASRVPPRQEFPRRFAGYSGRGAEIAPGHVVGLRPAHADRLCSKREDVRLSGRYSIRGTTPIVRFDSSLYSNGQCAHAIVAYSTSTATRQRDRESGLTECA